MHGAGILTIYVQSIPTILLVTGTLSLGVVFSLSVVFRMCTAHNHLAILG